MKPLVAGLFVLGAVLAVAGCRHPRDGKTASDPMTPPAYDTDAGASEYAPIPRYQTPSTPGAPAPSVTAQPGDVQL